MGDSMNRGSVVTSVSALAGVLLGALACCGTARAAMIVEATVTPDAGFYHYDLLITNSGPDDVVLVTLIDAPLADPLIGPSLTVPVGFLGNYDSGLGFVDFLADTDLFAAGTSKGLFSLDSLAAPTEDSFSRFQALTTNGDQLTGCVIINGSCIGPATVPEPASWVLLVLGLACISRVPGRRTANPIPE